MICKLHVCWFISKMYACLLCRHIWQTFSVHSQRCHTTPRSHSTTQMSSDKSSVLSASLYNATIRNINNVIICVRICRDWSLWSSSSSFLSAIPSSLFSSVFLNIVTRRQWISFVAHSLKYCGTGRHSFCVRQHICYSAYMLSPVCLSVCLSVCHMGGSVKNLEVRIMQLSPPGSPMTLVSSRLTSPRNSKGNLGSEGAKQERGMKNKQFSANKSPYLSNGAR